MLRASLLLLLVLSACGGDETISGQTAPSDVWRLIQIDDAPVTADTTIRFPEPGRVAGNGPCNSYTANQTAPLPWIGIGAIAATRSTCPDLAAEARYFELLGQMAFVEVLGDTLLMTSQDGLAMTFRREP